MSVSLERLVYFSFVVIGGLAYTSTVVKKILSLFCHPFCVKWNGTQIVYFEKPIY